MMGNREQAGSDYKIPNTPEYPPAICSKWKKGVSGLYLSGHPLDLPHQISQISTCTIARPAGRGPKRFDNQNVTILCSRQK